MSEGERQKFEAEIADEIVSAWAEQCQAEHAAGTLKWWTKTTREEVLSGCSPHLAVIVWRKLVEARAEQPSQTRAAEGWISVLDRLPNVEDKLLVLDDAAYVHMAYHRPDSETHRFDCDTYGLKISDVTHWMYVPEPPSAAAVPVEDRPAAKPDPEKFKNSCNRHSDCAAATEKFKVANGGRSPGFSFHCHDDECEDCFGC